MKPTMPQVGLKCCANSRPTAHSLFCSFDYAFGWRGYAGTVTVRIVPGAHESVLDEPHVRTLAEAFKQCLNEIHTNQSGGNSK